VLSSRIDPNRSSRSRHGDPDPRRVANDPHVSNVPDPWRLCLRAWKATERGTNLRTVRHRNHVCFVDVHRSNFDQVRVWLRQPDQLGSWRGQRQSYQSGRPGSRCNHKPGLFSQRLDSRFRWRRRRLDDRCALFRDRWWCCWRLPLVRIIGQHTGQRIAQSANPATHLKMPVL
jgi:hypothetical protein